MNYSDYLAHHGIKGQKWGVRRYQNPDGSYTGAGRSRYGIEGHKEDSKAYKYNKPGESGWKGMGRAVKANTWGKLSDKQKKAIKIGAVVAGTALAAYATYKIAGPKIAAYRNNKAVQNAVRQSRIILKNGFLPNQNARNYAKRTIFSASNRTRQAAVNRNFPEYRVDSNNVYGVGMVKRVNISRPGSYRNMSRYKSPNFRVSGRASTNSTMSRRGINRSYTAKVRSDSAKVKQMTAELMKDHNWDSKTAENYAWWQLRNRGAYYNN